MIIRRKKVTPRVSKEAQESVKQREMRKKYPDEYRAEIPSKELVVNDHLKLVFQLRRQGEFGLPFVDIRHYITTDKYVGFTKQGITLPASLMDEFTKYVTEINDYCDEHSLGTEFSEEDLKQ